MNCYIFSKDIIYDVNLYTSSNDILSITGTELNDYWIKYYNKLPIKERYFFLAQPFHIKKIYQIYACCYLKYIDIFDLRIKHYLTVNNSKIYSNIFSNFRRFN